MWRGYGAMVRLYAALYVEGILKLPKKSVVKKISLV